MMTRPSMRSCLAAALAAVLFVAAGQSALALSAGNGPTSVAPLAKRLSDAVVNISTSQTVRGPQGVPLPNVPKGAPFEDFFEDFFGRRGGGMPRGDRKVSSLGSGFVIDGKEGLIVTNNHVIEGADEIVVNFHDGSKLVVEKVIGRDLKADIALLKVTPKKPLTDVKFGSSETIEVGDWVLAIGNPFGLGGSVSVGIISAKSRDINAGPYDDFLQTDAAINKGNSGGPLFNMDGEVVGLNTAIISPTGGSIGIGFAVPSDTVAAVVDQLKQYGRTRRGWLGVKIQTLSDDIAESLGLPEGTGALISDVDPSGPAAAAGIKSGDVIMTFDGKQVTSVRGLPRIVAQTPIDKEVDVELMRGNSKTTLKVKVGLMQEDDFADAAKPTNDNPAAPVTGETVLGLKLTPLTDALRAKLGLTGKQSGLVVEDIDPASPAASKDIKVGDLIVEAAQTPVAAMVDLQRSLENVRKSGRKAVLLRIENGKGDLRFVAVPIS